MRISLMMAVARRRLAGPSLPISIYGLRETIETRRLVDKAKGVLMKQGLAEPEAHRKMQKLDGQAKTLKEVAEAIILMTS